MESPKTSLLLFGCLLLIISVNSEIAQVDWNPYCTGSGNLELTVGAPQNEAYFDASSSYYDDTTLDTVELLVAFGDGNTHQFKFSVYDDAFQTYQKVKCAGTATYTLLGLLNEMIVLQDPATSKYYGCRFDLNIVNADEEVPIIELVLPDTITTPTKFVPYFWNTIKRELYVAIMDTTTAGIFKYFYPAPASVAAGVSITATDKGKCLQNSGSLEMNIQGIVGNDRAVYAPGLTSLKTVSSGVWADQTLLPVADGDIVTFAPIQEDRFGLAVLSPNMLSGDIYFIKPSDLGSGTVTETYSISSESQPFGVAYDTLRNFFVYGDNFFYWLNLEGWSNFRSVKLESNDISPYNIVDVALSGNKLIILYEDEIYYYRMTGSGLANSGEGYTSAIELLFSREYSNDLDGGMFRFGLNCVCESLKRFSCFSSTLNCLIIKKGGDACSSGKDVPLVEP